MMNEPKFTPGPWRVGISAASKYSMMNYYVFAERKFDPGHPFAPELFICRTDSTIVERDFDERRANAALIAAAPEMYDMLKRICEMQEKNYGDGIETHIALIAMTQKAREILKKARGE